MPHLLRLVPLTALATLTILFGACGQRTPPEEGSRGEAPSQSAETGPTAEQRPVCREVPVALEVLPRAPQRGGGAEPSPLAPPLWSPRVAPGDIDIRRVRRREYVFAAPAPRTTPGSATAR